MREASVGFQCPECVAEGRRTQRAPQTAFGAQAGAGVRGYATTFLIGLNVLAMVVVVASGGMNALFSSGLFGSETVVHCQGALLSVAKVRFADGPCAGMILTGVDGGAYYRLFTSMFLHYGALHLLMNMYALWILGRNLEIAFGPVRFVALYLLAGLGGSVASYLFAAPTALTAGASGAVFGLFSALFIALKRLKRDTSSVIPIIVVNLIFTFAVPGISISGHLGGLVTGALAGLGLAYAPPKYRTPVQIAVVGGLFVVLALITLAVSTSR